MENIFVCWLIFFPFSLEMKFYVTPHVLSITTVNYETICNISGCCLRIVVSRPVTRMFRVYTFHIPLPYARSPVQYAEASCTYGSVSLDSKTNIAYRFINGPMARSDCWIAGASTGTCVVTFSAILCAHNYSVKAAVRLRNVARAVCIVRGCQFVNKYKYCVSYQ